MKVPGFLVNLSATVTCAHQGMAKPTVSAPNVLVMGQPVSLQTSPYVIALCTLPPPPAANGPCATAPTWFNAAKRVFANGVPVLLQDSQSICVPSGTPLLITFTQTRVTGM
jgi:hypothetical protein